MRRVATRRVAAEKLGELAPEVVVGIVISPCSSGREWGAAGGLPWLEPPLHTDVERAIGKSTGGAHLRSKHYGCTTIPDISTTSKSLPCTCVRLCRSASFHRGS